MTEKEFDKEMKKRGFEIDYQYDGKWYTLWVNTLSGEICWLSVRIANGNVGLEAGSIDIFDEILYEVDNGHAYYWMIPKEGSFEFTLDFIDYNLLAYGIE